MSLVGVTVAIHLAQVGFAATQIGLLIGVGLAGSSLATIMVGLRGNVGEASESWSASRSSARPATFALAAFTNALALVPLAFIGMLSAPG